MNMKKIKYILFLIASFCIFEVTNNQVYAQEVDCSQGYQYGCNLGFMATTPPNFSGWTARSGTYGCSGNWFSGNVQYYSNPSTATNNGGNIFTIVTNPNEFDQRSNNTLRKIPTHLGFTRSAQLANYYGGGDCSELSYTLQVTPENCLLTICYAMVIETPHQNEHLNNPTFEVDVVSADGNTLVNSCAFFQMCGDISTSALPTGWHVGQSGWAYCDWKQIKISLLDFDGMEVKIRFRVSDCCYSAHGGYGYIACKSEPPTIDVAGCAGGGDTVTTAAAPDGFAVYEWFETPYASQSQSELGSFYDQRDRTLSTNRVLVVRNDMMGEDNVKYYAVRLTSPTEHVAWNTSPAPACITYIPVTVNDMRARFIENTASRYIEVNPENERDLVGFRWSDVRNRVETFPMIEQRLLFGDGDSLVFNYDIAGNSWSLNPITPLEDNHCEITTTEAGDYDIIYHEYAPGDYDYVRTATTVSLTDTTTCDKQITFPVHVAVRPNLILISRDTICINDSVKITTFSGEDNTENYVYQWYNGSDDPTQVQPFYEGRDYTINGLDKDTIIKVKVTNTDGNTYRWAYDTIYVQSFPDIVIEGDTLICLGNILDLKAWDSTGFTRSMRWTFQKPTISSNVGNGSNPAVFYQPLNQDTTIYILAETTKGCFAWDSVNIVVVRPMVSSDKRKICPGDPVVLTGSGASEYSWRSIPEDNSLSTETSAEPVTVTPDTTTIYTMSGYGENGCHTDVNITIQVIPYPEAIIGFTPSYVDVEKPTVMLVDSSSTVTNSVWTFSDGGTINGISAMYQFHDLSVDQVGVHLQSYNELGCMTEADTTIDVILFAVWLPTGFTPDGDGYNDYFFFITENTITDVSFEIYNRWGTEIYSFQTNRYEYGGPTDCQLYGWNGKIDDKEVENGTYIWRLKYKREGSSRVFNRTGTITVIR